MISTDIVTRIDIVSQMHPHRFKTRPKGLWDLKNLLHFANFLLDLIFCVINLYFF